MKAYFIIRDFVNDAYISESSGIALKSYKIDGIETLTDQFFIENQIVSAIGKDDYFYCIADPDGSNPVGSENYNTYNPFNKHLGTVYPLVNDMMRGLPIGTKSGNNYGLGVMNIGVDVPKVQTFGSGLIEGAFFIEIDFTKDLYVEFDIITNVVNTEVFTEPQTIRKYKIIWDVKKCYKEFSYFSFQTNFNYNDSGFGFLKGAITLASGESPFIDFNAIECGEGVKCQDKERTISYALFIDIPDEEISPETIKSCCHQSIVFAQTDGTDNDKNDYTGIYHKKQIQSETAKFFLINLSTNDEIELNDNNLGVYKNFGSIAENPDLKTFILSWNRVLSELGEGVYTILKRVTIAGMNYEQSDINYTLKIWSAKKADKTVRIDILTNGLMERLKVDFKNSNFETSLRFGGFFGRREPKFEEDNIIYSNYVSEQISMKQTNEFLLQSNLLPSCITKQIFDFVLFANDIYITDYNLNNHLRDLIKYPVKYGDNKGTNYFSTSTSAVINLSFTDKIVNNIKRNY